MHTQYEASGQWTRGSPTNEYQLGNPICSFCNSGWEKMPLRFLDATWFEGVYESFGAPFAWLNTLTCGSSTSIYRRVSAFHVFSKPCFLRAALFVSSETRRACEFFLTSRSYSGLVSAWISFILTALPEARGSWVAHAGPCLDFSFHTAAGCTSHSTASLQHPAHIASSSPQAAQRVSEPPINFSTVPHLRFCLLTCFSAACLS